MTDGKHVHFAGGFEHKGFTVVMTPRGDPPGKESASASASAAWPDGFINPIIHMTPSSVGRASGICLAPCMADDAVAGGKCKNAACHNVVDRDVIFTKATMANLLTACGPKPAAMEACETGIPTTEELCEANGISYDSATAKCGTAPCKDEPGKHQNPGFLIDECVYDVCAGGGDAVVDSYFMEAQDMCNGDDGLPVFETPPSPSPPPSPPPPPSPSPSPPPPPSPWPSPPPPEISPSPAPPPPSPSPAPPPPSPSPLAQPESETFDDPHISTLSGE